MTQPVRGKMIWLDEDTAHALCIALYWWLHYSGFKVKSASSKKTKNSLEEIMRQCGHPNEEHQCDQCPEEPEPEVRVSFTDILDAVFK